MSLNIKKWTIPYTANLCILDAIITKIKSGKRKGKEKDWRILKQNPLLIKASAKEEKRIFFVSWSIFNITFPIP